MTTSPTMGPRGPKGSRGPIGPPGPPGTPADPAALVALQAQVNANQRQVRKWNKRTNRRVRDLSICVTAALCVLFLVVGLTVLWLGASNRNTGNVLGALDERVTVLESFTLDFGPRVGVLETQVAGDEQELVDLRTWLSDELSYVQGDIGRLYDALDARLGVLEARPPDEPMTADEFRLMVLGVLEECGIPCYTCGAAPPPTTCPTCQPVVIVVTTTTTQPANTTTTAATTTSSSTTSSTTPSTTSTTVSPTTTTTTQPPPTTTTTSTTVPPTTTTTTAPAVEWCPAEYNPLPYPIPIDHPHCGFPQPEPPSGP